MAKIYNNNSTFGVHDTVNQFQYYERHGKQLVRKPGVRTAPFSAGQKNQQSKFKEGVRYYNSIKHDAAMMLAYRKKAGPGQTAYNVAVADSMNAPVIESVNINGLIAQTGLQISVIAKDDFRVAEVRIRIEDANGNVLEEANAIPIAIGTTDNFNWVYTTTAAGVAVVGNKVSVTARDLPGNFITKEKII
jgi:hypothetical protein